jgi:O-acetyl-ADP-ribose deacetylase (regulator of RNase III)
MEVLGERVVGTTRIAVARADITTLEVDAVVNAANEHLAHGGGVAAAIAQAGAPDVDAESRAWVRDHGPVGPGEAAVTSAGAMPARWVVHVVGPRYRVGQDNAGLLAEAVTAALSSVASLGAASIALPAISAGIFGYPPDDAASVIAATVAAWARTHEDPAEVLLVGYDAAMAGHFAAALRDLDA